MSTREKVDPVFILNGEVYIHSESYARSLLALAEEAKKAANMSLDPAYVISHTVSASLLEEMAKSILSGLESAKKVASPNLDWLKAAISDRE